MFVPQLNVVCILTSCSLSHPFSYYPPIYIYVIQIISSFQGFRWKFSMSFKFSPATTCPSHLIFFYMKAVVLIVTVNILKSSLHCFVDRLISSSALGISNCLITPLPKTVSPFLATPVYLSLRQVNMSLWIRNVTGRFGFLNYIVSRIFLFPPQNLL